MPRKKVESVSRAAAQAAAEDMTKMPEQLTLAQAIVRASAGLKALKASGLNRNAIVILLAAETQLSRRDCGLVLDALGQMAKVYCE